jgi:hypothetical protein
MKDIFLTLPIGRQEYCDVWGNLRNNPIQIIEEHHGDNFIKIFIYEYEHHFYYGYQLKVGTMIRQKLANVKDENYTSIDNIARAASAKIKTLCDTNKNVRKLFEDFTKIRYNQPELF